jgi:hypothetical protein
MFRWQDWQDTDPANAGSVDATVCCKEEHMIVPRMMRNSITRKTRFRIIIKFNAEYWCIYGELCGLVKVF